MGRPINSRYLGATENASGDIEGDNNLTVSVKIGTNAATATGIILRQRSETRFKVDDSADGTGNQGVCELVNKTTPDLGEDEMSLQGVIDGTDGNRVFIRKVYNRTMIDFDNNRYTWEIQDDSSQTLLVITAI